MQIFLSNAYYTYTKNTTKPMTKNMKNFRESIVTNLIGPPPPNWRLKPRRAVRAVTFQQIQFFKESSCT